MGDVQCIMLNVGDSAPEFTITLASGGAYNDVGTFTLSEVLEDGPVVLAFYPAAFTSGCTDEMCAFRDAMPRFDNLDAQVFGVSVDLPFAQNIWIKQENLNFPMLSDWKHELIHSFDVVLPDMYGQIEVAQRSIFVIDQNGTITYAWVREGDNPDFTDLVNEVETAVAALA